jgi:uncharacterized protein (DUF342 family)
MEMCREDSVVVGVRIHIRHERNRLKKNHNNKKRIVPNNGSGLYTY